MGDVVKFKLRPKVEGRERPSEPGVVLILPMIKLERIETEASTLSNFPR